MKESLTTTNRVVIAGAVVALGCIVYANKVNSGESQDPQEQRPDATYAITKDCAQDPTAYQKFSLAPAQHLFVNAGLRSGQLKDQDVVTISGTAQELTVTPYKGEPRTVFPDRLNGGVIEEFPFNTLGSVAIAHVNGDLDPSVILACDLMVMTQHGQPLEGQVVNHMPPLQ